MQFQTTSRRKKGNEITKSSRLEFSEKFLANNFALSDAEVNTSTLLNWGGKADLLLLRTLLASSLKCWDPCFWEVMDDFVLLAYPSLGASRTLLQRLLARLNFTLGSKDLFFWYKWKKSLQWTMAAAQAAENHGYEWDLTWYLWRICIYQFQPEPTLEIQEWLQKHFEDILLWNISQIVMKTAPVSTRIVISYAMKWDIPLCVWWKVNRNWDSNMLRITK